MQSQRFWELQDSSISSMKAENASFQCTTLLRLQDITTYHSTILQVLSTHQKSYIKSQNDFYIHLKGERMAFHHPLSNFRYKTFKSLNWQNFLAAFSLQERGAKKKLPKRNAEIGISPSADGEKGVAPSPHKLLKKFDQNFYPTGKSR